MKKYSDTVSNKYFNAPNKSDVIQKRMNNAKSENKYYGDTIQKSSFGRLSTTAGKVISDIMGGGKAVPAATTAASAAARSVDELNKLAQSLSSTIKSRSNTTPVTDLLNQAIKEHSLAPDEASHIILGLKGITTTQRTAYLNDVARMAAGTTPSPTSAASVASTPSTPGAPRRTTTPTPELSEAEKAEKKRRQNQYIWEHIIDRMANNRVNVSDLAPDEIALITEIAPKFNSSVLNQRQIDSIARAGGLITRTSLVAPNPKNVTERVNSTSPMAANSNVPYGAQPTTFRHEIVISQSPFTNPEPVRVPESARTPDAPPNPFPNSPYSPEQISRYSSSFVAPQQSRKRNFWDRNSALWNAPHEYQQKVNFHTNQYEDLLRGKITDPRQRHEAATDLVTRGFIPRDAANKILSDFGDEKRVPPKLNRVSSKIKSVYQNNFSTNVPLSPERIARNERNKKLAVRAATAYGIGHYALPFAGAVVANELSKPQYTGDVNDPNFDFNEYKKTRWVRNIRDLAPDLFTAKKDVQKSVSKTKKINKISAGGIPGGGSDVDDIAEAAAADAVIQRMLPRTENVGRLFQPQEYSNQYFTNMRTGYGAFENAGNKSYERIIDEKGNTNWGRNITDMQTKSIMNSIKTAVKSSLNSPAIKDWAKAYVKETAKKNTGLTELTPEQELRRKVIRSTINALKPVANSPIATAITDKLKRDFNISNPQQLINAGERVAENSIKGGVGAMHGILNFNPLRDVAAEYARRGEKIPPINFKQIHQQEQGSRTKSRRDLAAREMLAPFIAPTGVPEYVWSTTKKPMTAEERKQHDANVATYHNINRQRFEDVKTGQDLSNLNSNNFDTGASRNVGMPSMGLNNRTNENIATNEQTNKRRDQDVWKSIAWSQGKYKPESKLEEIRLIATLDSLPQTIQAQLKPREKNNIDRLLEFFNPPAKEKKVYTALTPSALVGTSQPVVQTSTPTPTVQQQIKATPTVQRRIATSYANPEQIKAEAERAAKAKIQELIRQRGY